MIVIRQQDAFGPEAVPQHGLIGVGPLFHDPDNPRGVAGEDLESFLILAQVRGALVERIGGIDNNDQAALGFWIRRVQLV